MTQWLYRMMHRSQTSRRGQHNHIEKKVSLNVSRDVYFELVEMSIFFISVKDLLLR